MYPTETPKLGLRLSRGIPTRRTIWIADAHRDDGKRFVVQADEKLTAFVELNQRFAPMVSSVLVSIAESYCHTHKSHQGRQSRVVAA